MLDLAQLLRIPRVDAGFDISPDDGKIAFAWNKTGEWQIYQLSPSLLTSLPEGEENIKQLTSGIGAKFNPRYSPDGRHLAYALDVDGSESYHLVVCDLSTNTHTDLTPNITYALQPNFCWSPDGSQLAFLSDEQGHFSTYIMSSTGGDAQIILDTGHPAWQVEWSPDGKHLAVCYEMHGQDYGIIFVDIETEEVAKLRHSERQRRVSETETGIPSSSQNDIPLNAHAPQWSPDGKELAFHSDLHGRFNIGMHDLDTKEVTWLTNSEGDSQSPIVVSSSIRDSLLNYQFAYTQTKGAINWIELLGDEDGRKRYQLGKGIHSRIKFTSDLKRMVTTFSSPGQPPDLSMIDVESGEAIQLTHSMPEEISSEELILPEEIVYPGMDGVEVPALLFCPPQTPAPAVVMLHGGPNWHYSAEWNPVMSYFTSRGYVVLAPNYRGSTGYGRGWQYAARFDLGGVDTRDVAAGAQYLVREGLAIENKIAITGRSHGGYLTMTCLTQYPELWCAGSAMVPFTNWFKTHENSRADVQHWDIENMGDPKENHERWYNASPFFFLDKVNAPVQLICGGIDPRCPAVDSIETRDKLIELGKDVELDLYEDEGHIFLKQKNILDAELKRAEFLARHLDK